MSTQIREGDFSFIDSDFVRKTYEDAWETIHSCNEYIDFIRNKSINEPWMYNKNEMINKICNSLKYANIHSGASIALTMRAIEYIIKFGWNNWIKLNKI